MRERYHRAGSMSLRNRAHAGYPLPRVIDVGSQLGGHELVHRLGQGGMASLYLAKRPGAAGFSRYVAVKVVHPHLATDRRFVRMFIDEAKLSARISHPNVVHVEQLGEAEGTYYLVMEYVHGCSLAQLLDALGRERRALSVEVAVWLAVHIADGLHAAHETAGEDGTPLGIVHRDVSPHNVLISHAGHVKLIDFGIAKARGRRTETGFMKGKLRYLSPEHARGLSVDRRSDVYALGIVLWETLAMQRLFGQENEVELLEAVRQPTIPPLSAYSRAVPSALEAVVVSALQMDPQNRPQSALEMRKALATACPRALAVVPQEVAPLLLALLPDALELPAPIASDAADVFRDLDDEETQPALDTLTVKLPTAAWREDDAEPTKRLPVRRG